ncbi:MAG: serine/threonine-protein kinase [Myxococcota bacterium]
MGRGSASTASDHGSDSDERSSRVRRALEEDPWIGRVIDGRYRIEGVLGTGGVGVVYRAEHTGLRQPVALKVLRHGYEDIEMLRRRFEREATVLSQLRHPNVVSLSDYGIYRGIPYLVMERLHGRTLEDLLDAQGPPAPEDAVEIARSVARGLAFAHGIGVLHRDLKPGNVFLQELPDDPHHVKLLDFGLAKILVAELEQDGEPTITKAGTVIGTPAYMAPEQGAGQRVDARADVYSLGVLLFELLSGCPPFEADRRADLLRLHMVAPVPDPSSLRPGLVLGRDLQALLLKALAKEPSARYRDGKELLAAFDALEDGGATYQTPDVPDATRPTHIPTLHDVHQEPAVRAPAPRWLLSLVVIAALGALVVGIASLDGGPAPGEKYADVKPETPEAPPAPPSLFEAPLGDELTALRARLFAAESLDREAHLAMRVYQRLHPDDVRPSLFLAHDLVNRGAWAPAIERYKVALARDPRAKEDPRMLPDLLRAVQLERHAADATDAVVEIFGVDARPAAEEALARTENRPRRQRLRALLRRL